MKLIPVTEFINGSFTGSEEPDVFAQRLSDEGADALLAADRSSHDEDHERFTGLLRTLCRLCEFPVYAAGHIRRLEDVKKYLYAGCAGVVISASEDPALTLLGEASARFGREKLLFLEDTGHPELSRSTALAAGLILRSVPSGGQDALPDTPLFLWPESSPADTFPGMTPQDAPEGLIGASLADPSVSLLSLREDLDQKGFDMAACRSSLSWEDFKKGPDGLVPVIVQDYRTDEVLMLAYMDKEAFDTTLRTGRMTYFSRSRKEQWVKGLTSGHFQYVRSLDIDCDRDTILAKVKQIGAACHTGSRSCFFTSLTKKPYADTNPLRVFQSVYDVILDRKAHPKEGSYTNYLFDKGIDKILKKVGEECTEIVIAAKNPDPEEIKYEISDFLYHVMVLMAEKGISWEDITRELANR